jgi:ketosteroid isomerase-like protein
MKKIFKPTCLVLFLLLGSSILYGQEDPIKAARSYMQQAISAYKEKNYASYLENLQKAHSLRPDHPTIIYNLSGANALAGKPEMAIKLLSKVADMGLIYRAAEDDDFASIKDTEEFKRILKRFESNKLPTNNSSPAFTIQEKGLITEGIAYDPVEENFYVSSVRKRKILSIGKNGEVRDFSLPQDGLWGVFGMRVDAERRLLWVCSSAIEQMEDFKDEDKGSAGIFKYDLVSRKLIKRYILPKGHLLGDLTVNSRGELFTTDSLRPVIYTIPSQKDELKVFLDTEPFVSLQGLAFSGDDKNLFVADYSRGLYVIDTGSKKCVKVGQPEDMTMLAIDGLYFYKGSLIGVQNDINPNRVIRLHLNQELNSVESAEVLEANNPLFNEPTLGVVVKDKFYFIANSQWSSVDREGKQAPMDKLQAHLILKTDLSDLHSLVKSELDFARTAGEKGIRDAFVQFLADDSILFRPRPVAGKKWTQERPAAPGLLSWYPIFADISTGGDMGYTTGPWEFRLKGPDDKEVAHGNFVSVWKKQPDGYWRVIIDIGISNPPPVTVQKDLQTSSVSSTKSRGKIDPESEMTALKKLDSEFSRECAAKGTAVAYPSYLADEARLFRQNTFPIIGRQAIQSYLAEHSGKLSWQPAGGKISEAGDLGFTYGAAESVKADNQIEQNNYVRIWKRQPEGSWKVVLDITIPMPTQIRKTTKTQRAQEFFYLSLCFFVSLWFFSLSQSGRGGCGGRVGEREGVHTHTHTHITHYEFVTLQNFIASHTRNTHIFLIRGGVGGGRARPVVPPALHIELSCVSQRARAEGGWSYPTNTMGGELDYGVIQKGVGEV